VIDMPYQRMMLATPDLCYTPGWSFDSAIDQRGRRDRHREGPLHVQFPIAARASGLDILTVA
jgi:hypothetical protein